MAFSEETKLLLNNWDAYRDVLEAHKRLETEVQRALVGVEKLLRRCDWWSPAWHFTQRGTGQVYIGHDSWGKNANDEALVWVGCEGFTPEAIFGGQAPPRCYVWVSNSQAPRLTARLREVLGKTRVELDADAATGKSGNAYVIKTTVPSCTCEQVDQFETIVLKPIVTAFSHFARYQQQIAEAVTEYLSEKK